MAYIARFFSLENKVLSTSCDIFKSAEQKPRFGGLKSDCVKEFSFQNAIDEYINWLLETDKEKKISL